ncbi:MAG: hypothetical protein PHN45_01990, partial [Methylococcales bacterium]|nr:hypothetical protein [Methylococcales bacterium]
RSSDLSDRDMGGRPVIEYMRDTNLPRDQVLREDLPDAAPNDAPPIMPDMNYPSIRETKFGWISDFGSPDGGYMKEGDSLTQNDVTQGMINRSQMRIPTMMGPPSSQVSGVGDAIALNEPGGERRKSNGDVRMSLWGNNPGSPNATSGWLTRVDDISRDGRMRHANPFMSLWGSIASNPNATAGWKNRVSDIIADGRIRHPNSFMSLWGNNPENPNASAGWKTRVDDINKDGHIRHANKFLSLWGANAVSPETVGTNITLNNVFNGARISDRSTCVSDDFMMAGAPEPSFGGLNVNQRVPESRGRRPEVMAVTGNRGFGENMFDGFFSTGKMYDHLRSEWSRIGSRGGGMEGIYIQDMFNLTNSTSGRQYRSTEPECDLMQEVMKGLGSNSICGMSDPKAFDYLSPELLW